MEKVHVNSSRHDEWKRGTEAGDRAPRPHPPHEPPPPAVRRNATDFSLQEWPADRLRPGYEVKFLNSALRRSVITKFVSLPVIREPHLSAIIVRIQSRVPMIQPEKKYHFIINIYVSRFVWWTCRSSLKLVTISKFVTFGIRHKCCHKLCPKNADLCKTAYCY
jgi:hypothetical protein